MCISTPPEAMSSKMRKHWPTCFRRSRYSEPIEMRALAPRSQQAGGREWQWRMSRGNLSSLLTSDITNFVQRGTYNARTGPWSHLFHTLFHEYGRRVGMVPRSSLKGGKNSLMVEKRTRRPNTTQTKQPKAHRPSLHHHVVFPLC